MRRLLWLGIAGLALAVSGCIKIDQTLTLEKDGSGTLEIRYGMSEQAMAQLEAMEQMGQAMSEGAGGESEIETDTPFDFDFDEAEVREDFESQDIEGVELVSATSETADGWRYMNLEVTFDNLAALAKTDFFDDNELSLTKDAEGNYVLSQRSDEDEIAPDMGGDDAMQEQMMQQMAAMFAGMRLANRVVVPTEIVETNATEVDGRTAAWVYDIDEDPAVLTKLENLNMRVVFSGDGVSLDEL